MRFEINIPDSTKPELKALLAELAQSLSAHPELVESIRVNGGEDASIQNLFTADRLAKIDAAHASIRAGKGKTLAQLDQRLAATRTEWLAENQS